MAFYGHDARLTPRVDEQCEFTAAVSGLDLPAIDDEVAFEVVGKVVAFPHRA